MKFLKKIFLKDIENLDQHQQRKKIFCNELQKMFVQSPVKFVLDGLAVFTQTKSFESNQWIGNPNLKKLGLHRFRVQVAEKMAAQRRSHLAKFIDKEDVEYFQKNGFILKENFLPAHEFEQFKRELLFTPLQTRETLQGDTVTRRMALDGRTLHGLLVTQKFLFSQEWKNLLNYVAGFKVQPICYLQVIFSHVRKAKADPQTNLHSDTFHSSAKAWLFLEDVAEEDGPFVYVPGSHQLNEARLNSEYQKSLSISEKTDAMTRRGSFRISEEEVCQLGYPKPQSFSVKANTLLIADTYGFHARGKSTRPSVRIKLWAYARRNPFLPWLGGDPLSFPKVKFSSFILVKFRSLRKNIKEIPHGKKLGNCMQLILWFLPINSRENNWIFSMFLMD